MLCNFCYVKFERTGKKRFCSDNCKKLKRQERYTPEFRKNMSNRQKKLYAEGKIKGWTRRDMLKPSYPEQYFINYFTDNNISFEREVKKGKFFADFIWEDKKLILEIDGAQHEYPDHVERDIRKDQFLTELGYMVVRIKWYNPVNDSNRTTLYEQIEEFNNIFNGG